MSTRLQQVFLRTVNGGWLPILRGCKKIDAGSDMLETVDVFLDECRLRVAVYGTLAGETNGQAVVLYGSHTSILDWIYVVKGCRLGQVRLVGLLILRWLYPSFVPNLIPVSSKTLKKRGGWRGCIFGIWDRVEGISGEAAAILNRQVPDKASEALEQGIPVIIFPDGGLHSRDWFKGIGFIAERYWQKQPHRKVKFVPFHIKDGGESDGVWLKQNWSLLMREELERKVDLEIGPSLELGREAIEEKAGETKKRAEITTWRLQKHYDEWLKKVSEI